jgi:hypothetical protein
LEKEGLLGSLVWLAHKDSLDVFVRSQDETEGFGCFPHDLILDDVAGCWM